MKIKILIKKIISWILVILSVPFLLVAILDFINTRDSIDIFIFVVFIIPFIMGIKLMWSCKQSTSSNQEHRYDMDSLEGINTIPVPSPKNNIGNDLKHAEFPDKRISNLKRIKEAIVHNEAIKNDHLFITTNSTCAICSQYNRKVYSISGKSKHYPKLPKEISENGGGCPNCILGINTFLEGINTPPNDNSIKLQTTKTNSTPRNFSSVPDTTDINFPDWHVSVSFGKSSSDNYMKAVSLAKAAPQYHEQNDDGKILHQAIYSSKPDEYLAFIMLYELVENWKSSFAIINGQLIDRKVIKQLNYCYGDNCRSGNPKFCYGASYMTDNPFGCHRLQISACNHPWWSFYQKVGRRWLLDKQSLLKRIDSYAAIYSICPMFNYEHILKTLNQLPSSISDAQYQNIVQASSQTIYIDL